MKVGFTGHQRRPGIDWAWVADAVANELRRIALPLDGYSSLAAGADQVFARAVLAREGKLYAVIPRRDYERFFQPPERDEFHRLLSLATPIHLNLTGSPDRSFYEAGKYVADQSQVLIAVWDGHPSKGLGGTADVVKYARERGCAIRHINPVAQTVD